MPSDQARDAWKKWTDDDADTSSAEADEDHLRPTPPLGAGGGDAGLSQEGRQPHPSHDPGSSSGSEETDDPLGNDGEARHERRVAEHQLEIKRAPVRTRGIRFHQ